MVVILRSALMGKCIVILPNIGLFLTFCFFGISQKEPWKLLWSCLRCSLAQQNLFFFYEAYCPFSFSRCSLQGIRRESYYHSMGSYFGLLMHEVLLLHYLSNTFTVTNGNLGQVWSKWITLAKYIMLVRARGII